MRLKKQIAEIDAALSDQIVDKWDYRKMIYQELEDIKARLNKLENPESVNDDLVCDIIDGMNDVLEALEKL